MVWQCRGATDNLCIGLASGNGGGGGGVNAQAFKKTGNIRAGENCAEAEKTVLGG